MKSKHNIVTESKITQKYHTPKLRGFPLKNHSMQSLGSAAGSTLQSNRNPSLSLTVYFS